MRRCRAANSSATLTVSFLAFAPDSNDEQVQATADVGKGSVRDRPDLAARPQFRYHADLLGQGIRLLLKAGLGISGDSDVMLQAAVTRCQGHAQEQPWDRHVPGVGDHHDRADAALLAACHRIQIAEQHIAAGHELYSGYSSAAV